MAGFFEKISAGLSNTRDKFQEQVNVLLDKGPDLDEDFWYGLEEALISSDIGAPATIEIVDSLRDEARRKALPDAYAVFDLLNERIAEQFHKDEKSILDGDAAVLLFVGINGTGKTTTVGKIAKEASDAGVKVILGSADTFRAAAIEQLEVWANRAGVEMVTRERGSDPASVCYATIERAEEIDADLVLIDTAGRLHTSKDLMAELQKVCNVSRKRSKVPVYVILVIDATTGQNGLTQAKEFNNSLDLDGLIVTKLDGTAKGGIALAISKELELPILKVGVGEKIEDLRNFDPHNFARAFVGDLDSRQKDKHTEDDEETHVEIEQPILEVVEKEIEEELPAEEPVEDVVEETYTETETNLADKDEVVEEELIEETIEEKFVIEKEAEEEIDDTKTNIEEPVEDIIEETKWAEEESKSEVMEEKDTYDKEEIFVEEASEEIVKEKPKKKKKSLFERLFKD